MRLLVPSLELAAIPAIHDAGRVQGRVDRLARQTHMQAGQVAAGIEARGHLALRDRPEEVVRLVFLAAPDQLDRNAGELLGDGDGLAGVILDAAAPAEAAAEIVAIAPRTC